MPIFYKRTDGNIIRASTDYMKRVGGVSGLSSLPSVSQVVKAYDFPQADEEFAKLAPRQKLSSNCYEVVAPNA